jgi:methylmalonyl-CoA mutase
LDSALESEPMTTATPSLALATDFETPSLEAWHKLVDKALKGGDFEKRLVARTSDGIRIPPLYTRANARPEVSAPGLAPFTRGTKATVDGFGWSITTLIDHGDAQSANRAILADLDGGANAILVQVEAPGQNGVQLTNASDVATLLSGVYLDLAAVQFKPGLHDFRTTAALLEALPALNGTAGQRRLALNLDPIGNLARFGTSGGDIAAVLSETVRLAQRARAIDPSMRTLLVDATPYHGAGASEAQELACMAATLVAYLRAFEAAGVSPGNALLQINIHLTSDTDIFLTTAKLRAARTLIARIADACGAAQAARSMSITVVTATRMMAKRDPWTNLLRTTVATASAALGGADAIVVLPFSHAIGQSDDFARRIARNTQIVAQEESYLGRVVDPAGGSWYVEQLTTELAQQAWTTFQQIETAGGIVAKLTAGLIQDEIAIVAATRAKAIATGKLELTGISTFPRLGDEGVTIAPYPVEPAIDGHLSVKPLVPQRLSAGFEALRDAADASARKPEVFIASLGEIADHGVRTTWIKNFLASGGITSLTCDGYASPDAAAAAFKASGAIVACLASSDATYTLHAEATARALKTAGARHVAMACRPGDSEPALRSAGVDTFISSGQDALATLRELQLAVGAT